MQSAASRPKRYRAATPAVRRLRGPSCDWRRPPAVPVCLHASSTGGRRSYPRRPRSPCRAPCTDTEPRRTRPPGCTPRPLPASPPTGSATQGPGCFSARNRGRLRECPGTPPTSPTPAPARTRRSWDGSSLIPIRRRPAGAHRRSPATSPTPAARQLRGPSAATWTPRSC
jgi:hypothetical protein